MLTADEVSFFKELQDELNTQETFCQADPRFWVVEQECWYPCPKGYEDRIVVYDHDACSTMTLEEGVREAFARIEAELGNKGATEWLSSWGIMLGDSFDSWPMNGYAVDAIEDCICEHNAPWDVVYEQRHSEHADDTMFLTYRECCEHIKRNDYNYRNPRPYAMTAWRSPQVARLIEILRTADFDDMGEKKENNEREFYDADE